MYLNWNSASRTAMKQLSLLLIIISLTLSSFAQKEGASKLYGYKQKVLPGTVRVDAVGKELPRKPRYNYFIYLASNTRVEPVEIWVNGECYSVGSTEGATTPIEYSNPTIGGGKSQILVPKTKRRVLQLNPSLNKIKAPTSKGKTLSAKNELVVIYKSDGKLYYKTESKLNDLESVAMQ